MSRRVIVIILAILILGIVGGTAFYVIQRLQGTSTPENAPIATNPNLQQSESGSQQIIDPAGDEDNDGLSNADETLWGTDMYNPDTDGDGFLDGEEVGNNHNPTIAGPNDQLPPGFRVGRDITPFEITPTEPIAVDQFFVDDLRLETPSTNLSEEYESQYKGSDQNSTTLRQFVLAQPIITNLPTPTKNSVNVAPSSSPGQLNTYLATAGNLKIFSNQSLFQTALNDLFGEGDSSTMEGVILTIESYQKDLIQLEVPAVAENYHKLLVGYTELLSFTLDQTLVYEEDRARAFLAIRQWEEIDKRYVPLLEQELARLKSL